MNRKNGEPVEPCHETGAAEGEEELVELDPPEVEEIEDGEDIHVIN